MLAQRCAASSKEIKSVVEASASEVAAGTELVARTTSQMRAIDEAVGRVSSIIVEVANASSEQAEGIRQVNQAVSHLDGATQQNAALVEQAAATAQRLAEQADVLDEAVRLFTVAEASVRRRAPPARSAGVRRRCGANARGDQRMCASHAHAVEQEEADIDLIDRHYSHLDSPVLARTMATVSAHWLQGQADPSNNGV